MTPSSTLPSVRSLAAPAVLLAAFLGGWALHGPAAAAAPAPCDDTTFLRRASLDLVGRQPTAAELDAFLADASPGKRAAVVDRLLADPAWATNWARYFRDVILYRRSDDRAILMAKPLEDYLTGRLKADASWAAIARDIITAKGTPSEHGETAIIMAQMGETSDIAAEVSRVFLGIQIQCAQCHDHFTDRWKRNQFHEFAAFFPRIAIGRGGGDGLDRFEVVSFDAAPRRGATKPDNPRRGELEHRMPDLDDPSKPGTVMKPKLFLTGATLPLGTPDMDRRRTVARSITADDNPRRGELEHRMPDLDDPSKPGTVMKPKFFLTNSALPLGTPDMDRRRTVARSITADDNEWFPRAIVNRLWAELVGEGFYAGIDDLGPDREPREPALLDELGRTLVAADHDLRVLFRAIMATPAYQAEVTSRSNPDRPPATASCPQRLRADQVFTQILAALEVDEGRIAAGPAARAGKGTGKGTAAAGPRRQLSAPRSLFTQVFGYDPSLPREEVVGSIPQALLLMNSQPLAQALDGDRRFTALGRLLAAHPDDRELADEIFVRVLARHPEPDELAACVDHVQASASRAEGFEDIFWALINGAEFIHRR